MLAIFSPSTGETSETFITQMIQHLAPGRTVVVTWNREKASWLDAPCLDLSVPDTFPRRIFARGMQEWKRATSKKNLSEGPIGRIARFLRQTKSQVLLSHYGPHSVIPAEAARRAGIPCFVHFHGYDASASLRDPQTVTAYREMAQHVAGFIVVSDLMQARLAAMGLPGHKMHRVPYGVDPNAFTGADPRSEPCRFLAVGRLTGKKGPIQTLAAFAKVAKQIPEVHLDYVGNGELMPAVRAYVEVTSLEDQVTLHGVQDHETVKNQMQSASVFVQHSLTNPETGDEEGLPVAILEAGANGLPVVATQHAGIPEEVEEGVTGFLVPEGDVAGMAARMLQLARDPALRNQMGSAARTKVSREFRVEEQLTKLRRVLVVRK